MKRIVVTIPAYNEEKTIGEVISKLKKILPEIAEIIVIDDGSTDNTPKVAEEKGAKVVSFAGNRGLVEVFKRGVSEALRYDPDIIVNIDGDGQHDPGEIRRLIVPIAKNKADVVIGSRFIGKIQKKSRSKYIGNIIFSRFISFLIRKRISDAQSGYRAYTSELAKRLRIHRGYTYTQQMIVQARYHGYKIVEVPITEKVRKDGKSRLIKNPFSFAYRAGTLLISVIAGYYPVIFFGTLAFLMIFFGLVIGIFLPTPRRIFAAVVIIIGIMSFMFGLLFKVINNLIDR